MFFPLLAAAFLAASLRPPRQRLLRRPNGFAARAWESASTARLPSPQTLLRIPPRYKNYGFRITKSISISE
jgi:hypothetical protein